MAIRWLEGYRKLLFLILLPVLIRSIDYHSSNDHFTICLFKNLTGSDCYGCGSLRGLSAFLHLDFRAMLQLNKLNLITIPVLLYIYCKELNKELNKARDKKATNDLTI